MAARGSGHQQDCAVCTRSFPAPPSHVRSLQRCPDCRASGRARCGDCGQETTVLPHASTYGALCEACRRTRARPCDACGSPFVASTEGVKRCPDCVARKRARCSGCGKELHVTTAYASRVLCPTCRQRRGEHFPTAERVEVRCRGYTLFGEPPHHAPNCAQTYRYTRAYLQALTTYDQAGNTFVSHPCSCTQVTVQGIRGQAKKAGMKPGRVRSPVYLTEILRDLEKRRRRTDRRWSGQQGRPGVAPKTLTEARRAGRGGGRGRGLAWANMVATWRNGAAQRVDCCRWCHKLLLSPTAPTHAPLQFHRRCYQEARRTEAGQEWWRSQFIEKVPHTEPEQLPIPQQSIRPVSSETLTRDFRWTILYLLGGERQTTLAKEAGIPQPDVTRAIKRVRGLLPDHTTANPQLRRYIEAFAQAESGSNDGT